MIDMLDYVRVANGYLPHGYCLQWNAPLLWTSVLADLLIAATYFSIPFALWYFSRKRPDIKERWLLVLFGLFVLACGVTHVFDVLSIWQPSYWAAAVAKVVTALLSLITAVVLWKIMPQALATPSIEQFQALQLQTSAQALYARSLLEATQDAMVTISVDGKIMDANSAAEAVTGKARSALIGTDFSAYFTEPDLARAAYQAAFANTRVSHHTLKIRHSDGHTTSVLYNASVYHHAAGAVAGVLVSAQDISEMLKVEEQLRLANQELQAFAYSVSHDLRAPLRGIDGWSLAILEDYADRLDATGRSYLATIRTEAQRMGELIDDMLQFSRVVQAELKQETVDLTALAQTVAQRLRQANAQRHLEFDIAPDLHALGDAHLLEVVLTNLLANAVKFTGPRASAKITVGSAALAASGGNHATQAFFVRDNGVGFELSKAKRLFGTFQRLHSASEFPGNGVGLATVQRIVRRHQGRVWADAQLDQGATFYFTIGEFA